MDNKQLRPSERHDFIVIGGGSSGAVMAARLSEDPSRRVLLLEAGATKPTTGAAANILRNPNQVAIVPDMNWQFQCRIRNEVKSAAGMFEYEAGKLLGGSSAINAVLALRGAPVDFDQWAADCGSEWSWDAVLPFYRALENDPIGSDAVHGRTGPLPIRRESKDQLAPLQAGLAAACIAHGFPETEDHNDPHATGVGVIPKNMLDGARVSTAMAYLDPVLGRPNLTIVNDVFVTRLLWKDASHCDGVQVDIHGKRSNFYSDNVIVCAGAINTPAILMRSGIGDPALLEPLDIQPRIALKGVGENLMDHPVVGIWGMPKKESCTAGEPLRQTLLRYSSSDSGFKDDMHICIMAGVNATDMFPGRESTAGLDTLAGLTVSFNKSTSAGTVRLASTDPHVKPNVLINCLGEKSDVPPLKEGIRMGWSLLKHPELQSKFQKILAWTDGMVASDKALEQAITTFVRPAAHLCGSARMGLSPDRGDVVDAQGRVYGVENLWVADASVMPRVLSATSNLTVIMVAEKIAAALRERI